MMACEEGGGGAAATGGGGIDRGAISNNLHWKKELSQIRKAARVLRDPGTSPSPQPPPPLGSARSLTEHQINNGRIEGNVGSSPSKHLLHVGTYNGNQTAQERESRRVCLYNWRSQKSESERSRMIDDDECGKDEGSSSSLEVDSVNSVRNDDSKSDGYLSDRLTAAFLKCMNSSFKKKSKRSNYSSPTLGRRKENFRMNVVDGSTSVRSGREDSMSLIDQSDENGDYCNSKDLGRDSAISHLLARLKSKGWACPPVKMMRSTSSRTLSARSYNRYVIRNASTVDSWDAITGLLDHSDDEVDLAVGQGCGIRCSWSRRSTPKSRNGTSYSPSLSDILIRKGSSFLCGSHIMSQARHHHASLSSNKRRLSSKEAAESLVPLLDNSAVGLGGSSVRSRHSDDANDDDLSARIAELDLESLSRLIGRGPSSSCRGQEGIDSVAPNREVREEDSPETTRSLSRKYRPTCFDDIVGQHLVAQSLMNAVSRGRIAPIYLFQGPRGVGKTSMARTFAAALNCLAIEDSKPCGVCKECADILSGRSRFLEEVDGSDKKGVDRLKNLLRKVLSIHPMELPHYKVFVIDQCHLLPSKAWIEFLRALHKQLSFVVFILVTTDIDNVPRTISNQCQKHILNKISNEDVVAQLRKISIEENLDVESNALELIASNADGSLRDAETMLDQLSLFGKQITKSLVNELMGVVSDDKVVELLELAMSSNATETVRRAREVMDSGVDPLVLISQLVTLIVDMIAGTHLSVDASHNSSFFGGKPLSEREVRRLKHALTLLSEAEKHLRVSSERSTWFTATLLQLGSMPSPGRTVSTSNRRRASKASEEDRISMHDEATNAQLVKWGSPTSFNIDGHCNSTSTRSPTTCVDPEMLIAIWLLCIEKCQSRTLRLLLHSSGKLVSVSDTEGGFIAHVTFEDSDIKKRAEGFLSNITNSFEAVLRRNVKVKISLLQDTLDHEVINEIPVTMENKSTCSDATGESFDESKIHQKKGTESVSEKASLSMGDGKSDEPIIHEQNPKPAPLQASDEGTPRSMSHSRPEQDGMDDPNEPDSSGSRGRGCTGMLCWNDRMRPRRGC